jgi:hypothetical protein
VVTYGPWQESREHEEIIYARNTDVAPDNHAVLLGEQPTQRSGWSLQGGRSYDVIGGAGDRVPGNISSPPPPSAELSLQAFEAALNNPVTDGYEMQHAAYWNGSTNQTGPGVWGRGHGWTLGGIQYEMGWTGMPPSDQYDERLAVPPGFPVYVEDEYTVQLENYATGAGNLRPYLVEAEVLPMVPPVSDGNADLFVKDAGVTTNFLFLGPQGTPSGAVSIEASKQRGPGPLNLEAMQAMMDQVTDDPNNLPAYFSDGFPKMAVLWNAGPVAVAEYGSELYSYGEGGRVAVRIRWKMPRWRQVFFEDPPVEPEPALDAQAPRRVFPRDDGLVGGSPRTYPPSEALQSSNRVAGAYLRARSCDNGHLRTEHRERDSREPRLRQARDPHLPPDGPRPLDPRPPRLAQRSDPVGAQ